MLWPIDGYLVTKNPKQKGYGKMKNIVTNFNRSLGNGKAMGVAFKDAIDHVIAERDTTVIIKLLNACKAKGDTQAERAIRVTFAAIFDGSKVTKTKTGGIAIKIKDATLSNAAVDTLAKLVADETSMRGSNWAKAFKSDDDGEAELDYIKAANNLLKRGFDPIALIAAIQQQAKQAA